jgi:hypothetical protein
MIIGPQFYIWVVDLPNIRTFNGEHCSPDLGNIICSDQNSLFMFFVICFCSDYDRGTQKGDSDMEDGELPEDGEIVDEEEQRGRRQGI